VEYIGQVSWSLQSSLARAAVCKFAAAAVLCSSFISSHASSSIAEVSFTATIDRVAAPEGVTVPSDLAADKQVNGMISFTAGERRDARNSGGRYFWRTDLGGSASIRLSSPLDSLNEHLVFRVDAIKKKINIVCLDVCKLGGGITLDGNGSIWQTTRLYLLAPGVVPDDLSQLQAIEQLIKFANEKQSKILLNFKERPDDSDVKAVRVVLSIDSMQIQ